MEPNVRLYTSLEPRIILGPRLLLIQYTMHNKVHITKFKFTIQMYYITYNIYMYYIIYPH